MKPKTMILMVVAVACGLGASYMTSKLLAERSNKGGDEPTVPVLVSTARIASWQPIKEPDKYFEVRPFPQSLAPPKALTDPSELKDQRLNKLLDVGKPVTKDDLLTKEQLSLAENLLPGQRAIAIRVTAESLVAGFVLPGTRVDVVCTTTGAESEARIILQNMLVMAVDAQDQRPTDTKFVAVGQTVTLAATPEESTRLSLAQRLGELRLLLKSGADTKRTYNVVSKQKDLTKPLTEGDKDPEAARPTATVTPTLPDVKDEPKPVVRAEEEKKVEKKRKRHVMTIRHGANTEKAIFLLGGEDEDEDSATSSPAKKDTDEKSKDDKKKPEETKPAAPAPPPPSAFGKSTRTGRIR
jgi:pilus assembly protein CpaB